MLEEDVGFDRSLCLSPELIITPVVTIKPHALLFHSYFIIIKIIVIVITMYYTMFAFIMELIIEYFITEASSFDAITITCIGYYPTG